MKRTYFWTRYLLIGLVVALAYLLQLPSDNPAISPSAEPAEQASVLHGPYALLRVIDGDTLAIDLDGEAVTVRLIGIDAPESVHPDRERNTPEGEKASLFLKDLLADSDGQLYLEYDVQRMDDYDRTLAYVYLSDGATMLQEELLRAGMATTLTIYPNIKYADCFAALLRENKAEERQR